jgi:hypothetical protein
MIGRFLVILGLVIVLTGLFWPFLTRLGLGRLPGDVVIERENFTVYLPFMTSIVISLVLSFVLSAALWFGSQR